jgi:hypothetical protein
VDFFAGSQIILKIRLPSLLKPVCLIGWFEYTSLAKEPLKKQRMVFILFINEFTET